MIRRNISYIVVSLLLISGPISAQEVSADYESKRSKRQLKLEERQRTREANKLEGVEALADGDFVLKADEITISSNITSVTNQNSALVSSNFNFLKVTDDIVTIQLGSATRASRAGRARIYEGKIDRFGIKDKGEGKSFSAVIEFTSPNSNNILSVHLIIWGEKAQARFYDGRNEVLMEGKHTKISKSNLWKASARIRPMGR